MSSLRSERQRLFSAVTDLLRRLAASSPVLLVLEDLHAADSASLELLHYVARTTREHPVLILATFRAEEASPGTTLGQLVGALRREQLAERLDLARLAQPASDVLVSALVNSEPIDRAVVDSIHQVAAGNPLYTEELLRTLRESGRLHQVDGRWQLTGEGMPLPGSTLDMLAARMERLGSAALQVLTMAAVVGQESAYPLLRAATALPDNALLDALDACLTNAVLKETPDGYRFGHPLQRAALYERLSQAAGRPCTAAWPRHSSSSTRARWQSMPRYWRITGRAAIAAVDRAHLLSAGDRAMAVHANEAAEAAYRQALDLLDAPEGPVDRYAVAALLWEKLGDVRALAGTARLRTPTPPAPTHCNVRPRSTGTRRACTARQRMPRSPDTPWMLPPASRCRRDNARRRPRIR